MATLQELEHPGVGFVSLTEALNLATRGPPHFYLRQRRQHLRILADKIELPDRPFGVLFHRGVCRAFLILPAQKHYPALLERTNTFVQKWGNDEWKAGKPRGHFTGPIF